MGVGGGWGAGAEEGKEDPQLRRFFSSLSRDFWLTNGLGSYCSSSESGASLRKYHGLFVFAPDGNPSNARLLLSKVEDAVVEGGRRHELSSNCYPGTVHPQGFRNLSKFEFDGVSARWHYSLPSPVGGGKTFEIVKEAWMGHHTHASFLRYSLPNSDYAPHDLSLEIIPLVSGRKTHSIGLPEVKFSYESDHVAFSTPIKWSLSMHFAKFTPRPATYYKMQYPLEFNRGEAGEEDLFSPGIFTANLPIGGSATLASRAPIPSFPHATLHPMEDIAQLHARKKRIFSEFYSYNHFPQLTHLEPLLSSADSFLTFFAGRRGIVAGFPYFGIWGRDAMISLPGIAIYTGRHGLARDILEGLFAFERNGIMPNYFSSEGANYDGADVSLWAIWALWHLESEGALRNEDRVRYWPTLKSIAYHYLKGNALVKTEHDGLLSLSNQRSTWMDAAIDEKAVTPRTGRRIEINSLWLFSLAYLRNFAASVNDTPTYNALDEAYSNALPSFSDFFNEYARYYDDGIKPTDGSLRPNQLWALALPSIPITPMHARGALSAVREHLLTPFGLRTLPPSDRNYHQHYSGSQKERDMAYHQGAVWPWLLGAYTDATLRHQRERSGEVSHLLAHIISDNSLGAHNTLAEIYDPTDLTPCGAPSQAWSVAETLRASIMLYRMKYSSGRLPSLLSEQH